MINKEALKQEIQFLNLRELQTMLSGITEVITEKQRIKKKASQDISMRRHNAMKGYAQSKYNQSQAA